MKTPAERIAAAYLTMRSTEEAARSLGRSRRWFCYQLQREDVQQAIDGLRREMLRRAADLLAANIVLASQTMTSLLRCGNERVELEAAKWILETVLLRAHTPDTVEVTD